ncbi:hypothetical protein SLEP1_g36412 [Rubroshorea leprosula]|uniref:Uncharacterized protein n=1 Tax=Rubroshorea leprosula TaxID=152421 RepID=A0AAV5KRX8_9ROSI|nr:hypothetical protein SLEP1_g36412 [Rubroshorea leprosula]
MHKGHGSQVLPVDNFRSSIFPTVAAAVTGAIAAAAGPYAAATTGPICCYYCCSAKAICSTAATGCHHRTHLLLLLLNSHLLCCCCKSHLLLLPNPSAAVSGSIRCYSSCCYSHQSLLLLLPPPKPTAAATTATGACCCCCCYRHRSLLLLLLPPPEPVAAAATTTGACCCYRHRSLLLLLLPPPPNSLSHLLCYCCFDVNWWGMGIPARIPVSRGEQVRGLWMVLLLVESCSGTDAKHTEGRKLAAERPGYNVSIIEWTNPLIGRVDIRSITDPKLQGEFNINAAWKAVVEIAMSCVLPIGIQRLDMSRALSELKECLDLEMGSRETQRTTQNQKFT